MTELLMSVIVPTRNRPDSLIRAISLLSEQDLPAADYEIVVVDDGSVPPVRLPEGPCGPTLKLIRLDGLERSAARNAGSKVASGRVLVLVDDDMRVNRDLLSQHLAAHRRWPEALVVGSVRFPKQAIARPFVRFREALEDRVVPEVPGPTPTPNFCAAANMSISRDLFQDIGGFDPVIVSGEDQDFALRHSALGRQIVFWPQARAIHHDNALDIRSYCRRVEWGSRNLVQFCRRHPDWPDNAERERVNSALRWGREPVTLSLRKLIKAVLALTLFRETLFLTTSVLERMVPNSRALDTLYRVLLGVHIRRGYRKGAKRNVRDVNNAEIPRGQEHQIERDVADAI
jgi:GT2 family glycosyltransferase